MKVVRLFLLFVSLTLISCFNAREKIDASSDGGGSCTYCDWEISVDSIQIITGTCSFNDCSPCSLYALMDVQEPTAGQIKLDPMIPGLLRGLYFEGTINTSTGQISTVHSAFSSSTLIAGWDLVNNTMGGQIYWKPNASCEAVIDFTGTLRN